MMKIKEKRREITALSYIFIKFISAAKAERKGNT